MSVKFYQVDAFTDKAFQGNPAAVCVLSEPREDEWMQNVAAEMNLSETAFVLPQDDGYSLRWFTPVVEVDLCGHATLASAHVLWEQGYLSERDEAKFFTKSGVLSARCSNNWMELNFPSEPDEACDCPPHLLEGLGVDHQDVIYVGRNRLDYLVELDSERTVRALQPNWSLLERLGPRGVIVTSRGTSEYDFVSRAFFPALGIPEDPVTGSAHCCLGPYWKRKLKKDEFLAYQASRRGGIIRVTVRDDRVLLGGQAVTVMLGEILG
ncbi:MAG: PhzF family phenazine biosynthesis protein [Alicyclobacillus sp.]|nr:PhzF family phenazine biosynthesis protein [Alicyclobacillus sp.]